MSTLPKPQRKPKETPTVAQWTSSSRAAARSLVEFTCCRAGAHDWVCAPQERHPSDPSPEVGANLYPRRAHLRAGPGVSLATPGPCMGMRAAGGQAGLCLPAALALLGAQTTPGVGPVIWVRSSIP
ncbi:protein F [Hepatitis C virus genotype 6]|uniref:protein F n=1 Tax=Hepatitis C virus genotype 6 TaxID=42182 RepID=UPI00083BA547|nr:protein F [Hepatitis C virus genotype 6]